MLTTAHLGLKKPEVTDASSTLRTAICDNADITEAGLWSPYASIGRLAAQSIPTGATPTAISFDTEIADLDNIWAIGAPTRIVNTTTGLYVVSAYVTLANLTEITLRAGGASIVARRKLAAAATGGEDVLSTLWITTSVSYLELLVAHSSGTAQNATAFLSIGRLGKS